MELENGDEAQAQHPLLHPPQQDRALGRGSGTTPSPPGQQQARADAPRKRAHVQAGALRDLHGGSPGGTRGSGDLARSTASNARAAGYRGGLREPPGTANSRSRQAARTSTPSPGTAPPPPHTRSDRSPPPRRRVSLTFTVTRPPWEGEARHGSEEKVGGDRNPFASARSVPLPSLRRALCASPPRRAQIPPRPLRRAARRSPIGCATLRAAPPLAASRRSPPPRPVRPRCSAYILFHPTMPRGERGAGRRGAVPRGGGGALPRCCEEPGPGLRELIPGVFQPPWGPGSPEVTLNLWEGLIALGRPNSLGGNCLGRAGPPRGPWVSQEQRGSSRAGGSLAEGCDTWLAQAGLRAHACPTSSHLGHSISLEWRCQETFCRSPLKKSPAKQKSRCSRAVLLPAPSRSHAALPGVDSGKMLPGLSCLLTRGVLIACVALRTRETTPATEIYLI